MRVSLLLWLMGVFLMSHAKAQELSRPIFICPTEAQSILCNTKVADIYYTNCTGEVISQSCYQCILPCKVEFETVDINCASSDCVYGLCSSYLSYFYSNTFNFTCRDLYTDQYCTYCETCLVSSPGNGSGGGNISTEICDNVYNYIFCRLLPENQVECYQRYGVAVCQQCSTLLEPFGCTRIDGQLTALQNETLCEAQSSICPSLPPAVNCTENQQIDCQFCSYLTTNEICDTQPTNPVFSCDDSLGLFCSLVNTGGACFQKYNTTTCEFCTVYSDCPPVQSDTLTLAQTNTLCNSTFGSICPFLLSLGAGSNCYPVYTAIPCDFCTETISICEYDNSTGSGDNSTQPDTCNSEYSLKCIYDIIYFPCIILYGNTYCSECSSVVESCDVDFGNGFLPPNLCSNENFVSLCYLATQLDDCASELSPSSCEFCSSFVNTICPTPSNPNVALSILCSTQNALVCQFLLDSEGECADPEHENDCAICRGRDTLCAGFSGSGDGCDSQTSLFCRLFVDESDCIFSDITCDICNDTIDICGPLEFSSLTVPDIVTLCRDFDTTCPSLLSNCGNFQFGCDQCAATQSICASGSGESGGGGGSAGSGASDACTSSLGAFLCRIVFVDETECLSQYSAEFCSNCSIEVDFCGALTYSDLTSNDVDFICDSVVFCPPFLTDPSLCRPEDQVGCNYACNAFEDLCTSGSGLLPICTSDEGHNCGFYYSYFPCYAGGDTYGCDVCAATVQSCPNLAFQPDYVPPEVCESDVYLASCNTIISDPLCYIVYGNELCQYCKLVNSECPTLSSDEIISALDSGCDDDYQYCQAILQSNRDECRQRYTAVDCGYCTLLNVYCQDVDNSSGSGSGVDCSDEISFFCNYATADSLCESNFFPSTCRYCQNYLAECSSGSGGGSGSIGDFCYSDFNLAVCGNFPLGSACRFLLPEYATTCDYCNFYADSCGYAICSDSDLINACTDLYYNGEVPTLSIYYDVSSETEQCTPCSLVSRVCPKLNETAGSGSSVMFTSLIFPSPSPSEFVFSSSEILFSSEIFSSSFIFSPSPQFTTTEAPDSTSTIATITTTSASATFVTTSTSAIVTTSESLSTSPVVTSVLVSTSSVTTSESVSTSSVATSESISTSSVITSVPVSTSPVVTSESVSTSFVITTSTISSTTTTTTRSTVSTTSDSTTRSTTTSTVTSPTPTRTSLPPEDQVDLDDLSDEERQNVVAMTFEGLTRTEFINNVDQFVETLEALIDAVINRRKRQSDDISVVVVTESLREVDGNLEIAFVARQRDGGVVNGNTVVVVVDANKQDIASSVGAEGIGEVSEGLPDYLDEEPSDSSGLSGGAVAGIVIVILVVVIVVLVVAGVAAGYYATHSRRGKYIIGTAGNDNEPRYIENPAALDGDSRDKLALSQSMPMQETDDSVTVSVVVKNENTLDEVNEKETQTKEVESSPDVVDSTQEATGGEEKEEEKKKDDHSSSDDSSDDEEDKKEKPKESKKVEEDEMITDL